MVYIGAEEIISPLGENIESNWNAAAANRSGIALIDFAGFDKSSIYLSKIAGWIVCDKFRMLVLGILKQVQEKVDQSVFNSPRTILLISSTKGSLDRNVNDPFGQTVCESKKVFGLAHDPVVVSNACISGVLAINMGHNLVASGQFDHAIVIGCDIISEFIIYGFQSLFAISSQPCKPFDSERNGISLGEGCAGVVISSDPDIYKEKPLHLLAGTSANDANHISGPSRTGEGLYRSVRKTMEINGIRPEDIDFVSAHGTATVFNDEMESIAFDRLSVGSQPVNSLKGYFGHTLGAAGVLETCMSMQMMKRNMILKSLGYAAPGTSKSLNIVTENRTAGLRTILKTASGFGGGNASLMIRQI